MAYRTYTTEALVVGSEEGISADKTFILFTRDIGLVYARAVSVRKEESKLRYGLQDFSLVTCSLIRGKYGWKLVGAERSASLYFNAPHRTARGALLRTVRLVRRFVRGEEAHTELYDTLIDGLRALHTCSEEENARVERIVTLRMLSVLGYVAPHKTYQNFLDIENLSMALATDFREDERILKMAIEDALTVSHL